MDETRTGPPPDATRTGPAPDATRSARPPGDTTSPADAPPRPTPPPESVPGYDLLEKLGEGGMGIVWKARDVQLNRIVALKMVLGTRAGPKELIRFLAEAEAVAAVKHPNVVQVYEFGECDGRPYLAMEYLPNPFSREAKPSAEVAKTMSKISRGVGAAHDLGIVHRDLKPGNVLLDESGTPKVTDFGLAKKGTQDLTNTQAVMGTPAYMSPEQAEAKSKFVTPAADVFSLGVMLYEQLTGTLPFAGDNALAVLKSIIGDDPPALKGLPRDISLICYKCLSKDPAERYATATELAADLEKFAAGETVSVRAAGPVERAAKWVRRKPETATAWAAGAVSLLLLAFGVTVFALYGQASRERDSAQLASTAEEQERKAAESAREKEEIARKAAERAKAESDVAKEKEEIARKAAEAARSGEAKARAAAEAAKEKLEATEYGQQIQLAHQATRDNNFAAANAILAGTNPKYRGWEFRHVDRLCHDSKFHLNGHTAGVYSVAFSPDGTRLATASSDKTVRVWNAASGKTVAELKGHTGEVRSVAFSPDGTRLATASFDATARVWDAATGKPVVELRGHTDWVWDVEFSPDGSRLATASYDATARVWDTATGKSVAELRGHTDRLSGVAYSPDGTRLATASGDRTARVWDSRPAKDLPWSRPVAPKPRPAK